MGVFELDRNSCGSYGNSSNNVGCGNCGDSGEVENVSDLRRLREECIIALKVYDSCRQQKCFNIHPYKFFRTFLKYKKACLKTKYKKSAKIIIVILFSLIKWCDY